MQHLSALYRRLPGQSEAESDDAEAQRYDALERAFCLRDGPDNEAYDRWFERCLTNLAGLPERRTLLQNGDVRDAEMALSPYDQRIRIEWGGDEFQGRRALVFAPADS